LKNQTILTNGLELWMSRKATILPEKFNFDKKAMTGMAGVI
jgi:hypothetical protein